MLAEPRNDGNFRGRFPYQSVPYEVMSLTWYFSAEGLSQWVLMGDEFRVRPATESDTELILQMIREMAAAERRQTAVSITNGAIDRHVFSEHSIADVYIGFWDDEPVAYLMVQNRFSSYSGAPILYVEDVFVRSRNRGLGLGKLMMQFAANLAVARGCGSMHWSVGEWNSPALAFYDRLGTTREKGRVHYSLEGSALQALGAK